MKRFFIWFSLNESNVMEVDDVEDDLADLVLLF